MNHAILYEIVTKLNGSVDATGDHGLDLQRLERLKNLTTLVDKLLLDIHSLKGYSERYEMSIKAIGDYAESFMAQIKEDY